MVVMQFGHRRVINNHEHMSLCDETVLFETDTACLRRDVATQSVLDSLGLNTSTFIQDL